MGLYYGVGKLEDMEHKLFSKYFRILVIQDL